jgi:hypothetical protein
VTLRVAAALSLLLGMTAFLGYLHILGEGPIVPREARHMRAMKERRDAPAAPEPFTFAAAESLPRHRPLAEYAPLERRGVILEGYIQFMLRSGDGDTHLGVTERAVPEPGTEGPYVTAEITPEWYRGSRRWRYERLLETFLPDGGGTVAHWSRPPRRVRLTGWLLYDFQYDPPLPPGASLSGARLTGWEIHPVTRIEVWDDARGGFVEVPR